MTDRTNSAEDADGAEDGVSRRWLIRVLVGLGLGIPIAVESVTFLGMVVERLLGGGETARRSTTTRASTGIGEDVLPETAPAETLQDAAVHTGTDAWRLTMTVSVVNTTDVPYTFRVDAVTTEAGTRVSESATTGRVPAGASRTLTHEWSLPVGELPGTMTATGILHAADGDRTTESVVRLGSIPVTG